jgi:hypothetical protein
MYYNALHPFITTGERTSNPTPDSITSRVQVWILDDGIIIIIIIIILQLGNWITR